MWNATCNALFLEKHHNKRNWHIFDIPIIADNLIFKYGVDKSPTISIIVSMNNELLHASVHTQLN